MLFIFITSFLALIFSEIITMNQEFIVITAGFLLISLGYRLIRRMLVRSLKTYRNPIKRMYKKKTKVVDNWAFTYICRQYFAKEMEILMRNLKSKFPIVGDRRERIQINKDPYFIFNKKPYIRY